MNAGASRKHDRFLLTTLTLGHLTNDWVVGTIWLIAPAIASSMGLGPAEVGLILAVNGIGAGLTYIPAGIAADRMSRQGLLMLLTFWWVALGYLCATLAPGFWPVTLLLAVGIMGDAFWHPVATGVLVRRFRGRRAQVLGIHAMGGTIGAEVLGPLSAGFLLGLFDWQTTVQILIVPAVLMGIVFIPVAHKLTESRQQTHSSRAFGKLARSWLHGRGAGLAASMIFYNMSLMAMLSMMPLYLQEKHQQSPFASGLVFAGILLVGTFLQPLAGRWSDQSGRKQVILKVVFLSALFALIAPMMSGLHFFIITLMVAVALQTAIRPVFLAAAVDFTDRAEATTLGIVFALLDGVGALGALLAGYVGEIDLRYAYLLAGAMAAISAAAAALISFNSGPDAATPAKL